MNPKYLICSLTAAVLLTSASVGVVRSEGSQHASHAGSSPLPDAVRQATARFLDIKQAIAEGYVESGGCVSGQEEGAMGVHYVKSLLFDGQLDVAQPEALVYEPNKGSLALVAVEYITPAAAWEGSHPGMLPGLMGHLFHFVPGPNRYGPDTFYELHVWAWKNNPRGSFA